MNESTLDTRIIQSIQTEIGEIIPCYFPVGQGIKNRVKAVEILRLSQIQPKGNRTPI